MTGSPEVYTFQLSHWTSSRSSLTSQVFLPRDCFRQQLHSWLGSGEPGLPVCACLSLQSLASGWPCVLTSLINPRRVADFSVCLAPYLWGRCGDFQVPYIQNQKLEVSIMHLVAKFMTCKNFFLSFKFIIRKHRDTWPRLRTCKSHFTTENYLIIPFLYC